MRLVIGVCVLVSEDVVNGSVNPGRHLGASLWPCRVICIELSRVGLYRWNNAFLIQVSQWWRDSCNLSIQMFPSAFHCSFISLKRLFFTAAVFRVETERSHHIPVSPDDITMTSSGFFFLILTSLLLSHRRRDSSVSSGFQWIYLYVRNC